MKVQLKFGELHAVSMSNHAALVSLAKALFGDGGNSGGSAPPPTTRDPNVTDLAAGHSDVNSAIAAINFAMRA